MTGENVPPQALRPFFSLRYKRNALFLPKNHKDMADIESRVNGILNFGPVEDTMKQIIKVVGVGGGGCNAVNNMYKEGITNVSFAVCNTDSQSLTDSPVPVKLLLGDSGLGAGADPEKGKSEALKTKEKVRQLFDDSTRMCFITAGMGGGTGTGAGPIIASVAKSMGLLTIGIATIPFYFEKKRKIIKALKGVEEMRKNVDALLIINNESICDVYADSDISIKAAFKAADDILCSAVKSISELITIEGSINLDFRDVETTMRGGGGAIMAIGRGRGTKRIEQAIHNALDSPLLYGSDITKAKNILFNIYTCDERPLFVSEMREVDAFMYELDPDIDVIWGTSDDNTLGEDAKVIILATGLDNRFMPDDTHEKNDDAYYDSIISHLYREPMLSQVAHHGDFHPKKPSPLPDETADSDVANVNEDDMTACIDGETAESGAETEGETPMPPTTGDAATPGSGDDDVQTGTDGKLPDTNTVDNGRGVKLPLFLKRMKSQLKRGLSEITNDLNEDA